MTDDDGWQRPPTGAVLGPLPVWALAVLVGALTGVSVASRVSRPLWWAGLGLAAAVVAAGGGLLRRRPVDPAAPVRSVRAGAGLVVAALLVGFALTAARAATTGWGALPRLAAQGGTATVTGTVVHEPRRITTGWHVVVRIDEVAGTPTRERAATTLEVEHPPPLGQRFRATTTARPLPDDGFGRWLAGQHVTVVLDLRSWQDVEAPGAWARSSEHVRDRVRRAGAAHTPPSVGGLLAGLATGDTRTLPEADRTAMEATALTHLTAVSGTHVALVTAGVYGLCLVLRLPAAARRVTLAGTLLWFAFLTRFEPSVLRASAMAGLVLLAGARGHARDARHALAGAVLLLVLIDPLLAGSLGLLLSASAAAGVLVLAPLVRRRLARLPRRLADVLAVTLGAQIAVVPLLLASFGTVPLAAVPANLLAVPAAALAASVGFVAAAVASVHLAAGAWLFALAGWPARMVLFAAHTFAGRGGTADLARPVTALALLAGCLLLLTRPRTRRSRVAALATFVLLAAAVAPAVLGARAPSALTVTAIDVGQGDAYLLESPRARILVDTGEDDRAARWLRTHGRRHLDLLVVTHVHADHVGGAVAVLDTTRVDAVWLRAPDVPAPDTEALAAGPDGRAPAVAELLTAAAERAIPVRAPATGDTVAVGDVRLEVLGPGPGRPYRASPSEPNDTSIVVRARWQDRAVLFAGDSERGAQADLLARAAASGAHPLRAELLAVPHHGASTTDPAFLAAVAPQVALISVGADNDYGHPSPSTLRTLQRLGAAIHRTDREGTVRVAVPPPRRRWPPRRRRPHRRRAGPPQTCRARHPPSVGCRYDSCTAARRRRRPVAATRTRTRPRRPARAGPRARGRDL